MKEIFTKVSGEILYSLRVGQKERTEHERRSVLQTGEILNALKDQVHLIGEILRLTIEDKNNLYRLFRAVEDQKLEVETCGKFTKEPLIEQVYLDANQGNLSELLIGTVYRHSRNLIYILNLEVQTASQMPGETSQTMTKLSFLVSSDKLNSENIKSLLMPVSKEKRELTVYDKPAPGSFRIKSTFQLKGVRYIHNTTYTYLGEVEGPNLGLVHLYGSNDIKDQNYTQVENTRRIDFGVQSTTQNS